jgi:WG containing repeat
MVLIFFIAGCRGSHHDSSTIAQDSAPDEEFYNVLFHNKGPLTVKVDGKYGYIDRTGKVIIKPQFDDAERFSGGSLGFVLANVNVLPPILNLMNPSGDT